MLSSSLKFSVLLILSQFVYNSQQQCLGISKIRGSDYSFALAGIKDISNPLGPQEACYFGCGAQIVTQSSNKGDMSRLTLMDNAVPVLRSSGFLQPGQTYFLNHLGMEEAEGGNGIGCIQLLPRNRIAHYPREHQMCSKASVAICGFWGQQSIPSQPRPIPSSFSVQPRSISTSTPIAIAPTTKSRLPPPQIIPTTSSQPINAPTRTRRPRPSRSPRPVQTQVRPTPITTTAISSSTNAPIVASSLSTTLPSISPIQEILPEIETISDIFPFVDEKVPSEEPPANAILHEFNADGHNYHVVNKDGNSLSQADQSCRKNQANMGGVTSAGYEQVAQKLLETLDTTGNKLIIGSWNGDNYSLQGNNCLILQINNGIYPGSCTEATAVLCQS